MIHPGDEITGEEREAAIMGGVDPEHVQEAWETFCCHFPAGTVPRSRWRSWWAEARRRLDAAKYKREQLVAKYGPSPAAAAPPPVTRAPSGETQDEVHTRWARERAEALKASGKTAAQVAAENMAKIAAITDGIGREGKRDGGRHRGAVRPSDTSQAQDSGVRLGTASRADPGSGGRAPRAAEGVDSGVAIGEGEGGRSGERAPVRQLGVVPDVREMTAEDRAAEVQRQLDMAKEFQQEAAAE